MMAATSWHREEPREVRPFFHAIQAQNALDGSGIRLFEGTDFRGESSFDLDEIDFKKLTPVVKIVLADTAQWLPPGISVNDLQLALIARHSFLKRSLLVRSIALSDKLPNEWPVESSTLERLGGGRNVQITLALCLSADLVPAPGSPFIAGHWLAQKSFLLRSRTMPTLFDLRTRKDEEWIARGFPPKTFYSVEYIGGIDTELDEGASVATVWIHEDAHNKMVSTTLGQSLQPVLAAEIISSIVLESFRDWKESDAVEAASPLATLLKQLGKEKPLTLQGLKVLAANPSLFKATLQDRLMVVAGLK